MRQIAENEISIEVLNSEFDIFFKDIKRVLYDNFKMKKKISEYDDRWLFNEIISYSGGDDDNYYRNSLVTILKILENVKTEVLTYDHEMLDNNYFSGIASFLHLLLLHINEFSSEVATAKEGKDYNRVKSRKRILAQEVFDLARRITRSQTYTNEMTHIYESIFFIRQAIELKILETFYIEAVINEKYDRPIKISPDIFIELLNKRV